MKKSNWLIHTKVNIEPFVSALNKCTKEINVTGHSSAIGPKTKQINFLENREYYEKTLYSTFNNICKEKPEHKNKIQIGKYKLSALWTVEGHENSYHRIHRHSNNEDLIRYDDCISTVLYVNVPKSNPKGEFYFLLEKEEDTIIQCIKPVVGDLFIFPWSLYHGVYPQGPGLRKTINCDLIYKTIQS